MINGDYIPPGTGVSHSSALLSAALARLGALLAMRMSMPGAFVAASLTGVTAFTVVE